MTATLLVVPHAHLRMRPIQWYLKDQWSSRHSLNQLVFINSDLVRALKWWTVDANLLVGRPFTPPLHTVTVTIDANMEGLGNYA